MQATEAGACDHQPTALKRHVHRLQNHAIPSPLHFVERARPISLFVASLLLALAAGLSSAHGQGFEPLFEREDLSKWHTTGPGMWTVQDSVIVGTKTASGERDGWLISIDTYRDFTLRLKYKCVEGNSGIQYRSTQNDNGLTGVQADICGSDGSLYALAIGEDGNYAGRGWLAKGDSTQIKKWRKEDAWNELEITARGQRVTTRLNGHEVADYMDEEGRMEGHFAFQLHSGIDAEVPVASRCSVSLPFSTPLARRGPRRGTAGEAPSSSAPAGRKRDAFPSSCIQRLLRIGPTRPRPRLYGASPHVPSRSGPAPLPLKASASVPHFLRGGGKAPLLSLQTGTILSTSSAVS